MRTMVLCVVIVLGVLCEPAWSQKVWRHDGANPNQGVGADLAAIRAYEGGDFDCDPLVCADFAVGLADLTLASQVQAARVLGGGLGTITDDTGCGGSTTFDFAGVGRAVAAIQNPCTGTGAVVAADWLLGTLAINGSTVVVPGAEPGFGFALASFDQNGDGVVSEIVISNPFHAGLRGSVVAFDLVVDAGTGCPTLSLVGRWIATGTNPGDLFGYSLDRVRDAARCRDGVLSGVADFQDDIIVGAPGGGYATLLSGADGTKLPLGTGPAGRFGVSVAGLGDLDGDGCPEIAVGTAAIQTGCGPFVPPGLQTTGPFEPGTVRVFRSATADDVTLHNPLGVTDASFGWSLAGDVDLDLDHVPDFIVGAPCANRGPMGAGFDGMAFAFSGVPQPSGPPFDWTGSFLGEIPGERMGYSLAVAEPSNKFIPLGRANGLVEDPCAVVAVGAPWADISGQSRAGRVYGFAGPEQLPVNNNCCASPPCFNACWVDQATGFPCAAPTLTITAPTTGTSCSQALDLCLGGPLTFTVSLDPTCLPPGTTSVEFLVLGSAGPVPTSFDSDFCLNLQPCSAYLPIQGDNVTHLLAGYSPAFSGSVNIGTDPATGTLAMNVPPLASSCAVGIELQFAAAIWVGPHATGKWVVGTLPASCLELL